jgi:hypothetical protein
VHKFASTELFTFFPTSNIAATACECWESKLDSDFNNFIHRQTEYIDIFAFGGIPLERYSNAHAKA